MNIDMVSFLRTFGVIFGIFNLFYPTSCLNVEEVGHDLDDSRQVLQEPEHQGPSANIPINPLEILRDAIQKRREVICDRMRIWTKSDFQSLRNCTVIEGSLQINVLFEFDSLDDQTFPQLKEITGFLMLFSTDGIKSLVKMFPRLVMIRGKELVEDYSLVISRMKNLQEIGLPYLTDINSGSVWAVGSKRLCFINTVNWAQILKGNGSVINAWDNGDNSTCSSQESCGPACGTSQNCWTKNKCQVIPEIAEGCHKKPCSNGLCYRNKCCHRHCSGGCYKEDSSQDCYACKGVSFGGVCVDKCPHGSFQYMGRRCLSRQKCLNVRARLPFSHPSSPGNYTSGKLYINKKGDGYCLLDCKTEGLYQAMNEENETLCVPCKRSLSFTEPCEKPCPGGVIDSIETASLYKGCSKIMSHLQIHIRTYSADILQKLESNLESIKEIRDYLVVSHTFTLTSLKFLKSLRKIRGIRRLEGKHVLKVTNNRNLEELFGSREVFINASVEHIMFHHNPKLCPQKIYNLITSGNMTILNKTMDFDIGLTNGDQVNCNIHNLSLKVSDIGTQFVAVWWEDFASNLTAPGYLVNYEVHYKEGKAADKAGANPCGQDGWNIVDFSPKLRRDKENFSFNLSNLKPFTVYSIYVKAVVIPDSLYDLNNNMGAESGILTITTNAGIPDKVNVLHVTAVSSSTLQVSWNAVGLKPIEFFELSVGRLEDKIREEKSPNAPKRHLVQQSPGGISLKCPAEMFASVKEEQVLKEMFATANVSQAQQNDSDVINENAFNNGSSRKRNRNPSSDMESVSESEMVDLILGHHLFTGVMTSFVSDENDRMSENTAIPPATPAPKEIEDDSFIPKFDKPNLAKNESKSRKPRSLDEINDSISRNPSTFLGTLKMGIEERVNFTKGKTEYTYVVKVPESFMQRYFIGVKACRSAESGAKSDHTMKICSEERIGGPFQPLTNLSNDLVTNITYTVPSNPPSRIILGWKIPANPNGRIVRYIIIVSRIGPIPQSFPETREFCVKHEDFLETNSVTIPLPKVAQTLTLNVAVEIRTVTSASAMFRPLSSEKLFITTVLYGTEISNNHFIINTGTGKERLYGLFIALLLLLLGSFVLFLAYKIVKRRTDLSRTYSANPEYAGLVNVIPSEVELSKNKLIKTDRILGRGNYGAVYEGRIMANATTSNLKLFQSLQNCLRVLLREPPHAQKCAIKELDYNPDGYLTLAEYMSEAKTMCTLKSPHVVKLLGVVSRERPFWIVMELLENGNLEKYLRRLRDTLQKTDRPLPHKCLLRMARDVADGLAYIHFKNLIHLDIAARNCLLDAHYNVKIGDFGLAASIREKNKNSDPDYCFFTSNTKFPYRWMPPEYFHIHDANNFFDFMSDKSDVWSYGVLLWEMWSFGQLPYSNFTVKLASHHIRSGNNPGILPDAPDIVKELWRDCWDPKPDQRPSSSSILERLITALPRDQNFEANSFFYSEDTRESSL